MGLSFVGQHYTLLWFLLVLLKWVNNCFPFSECLFLSWQGCGTSSSCSQICHWSSSCPLLTFSPSLRDLQGPKRYQFSIYFQMSPQDRLDWKVKAPGLELFDNRICLACVGCNGTSIWSSCTVVVAGSSRVGHCVGGISSPSWQHSQEEPVWWVTCIIHCPCKKSHTL